MLELIYEQTNELQGVTAQEKGADCSTPQFSTPNRAVLEPILADLDRLWEMRHWIPNPGEPIVPLNRIGKNYFAGNVVES